MEEIKYQNEQSGILSHCTPDTIDNVTHIERTIRERAIQVITKGLDSETVEDKKRVINIPLEFLDHGNILGAIWYIETVGTKGQDISIDILEKVYICAIQERDICITDEREDIVILDEGLEAIFLMGQNHPELRENSRFLLLYGNYEELHGNYQEADSLYRKSMKLGEIDAYMALALRHHQREEYEEEEMILRDCYEKTKDIHIIGHIIHSLCRQKRVSEAYREYTILEFLSKEPIPPFFIYREVIETDSDLLGLEEYLAKYITQKSGTPSKSLVATVQSASMYIKKKVDALTEKEEELKKRLKTFGPQEDDSEYEEIMFNKIWFYQTDILSLGNDRYIEAYLHQMYSMAFGELRSKFRGPLEVFLSQNGSREVLYEYELRRGQPFPRGTPMQLAINIIFHIGRVRELYFHHDYYKIQTNIIDPLLIEASNETCFKEALDDENDMSNAVNIIRDRKNFFESLRPSLQETYKQFVRSFDAKYGAFYRRYIQFLATDGNTDIEKYSHLLQQCQDVALLFLLERIPTGFFPRDTETIKDLIEKYGLNLGALIHGTLLSGFLMDTSPEYGTYLLAEYPATLNLPESLYMITEGMRYFRDDTKVREAVEKLNKIVRSQYGGNSFFEYAKMVAQYFLDDPESSDQEKAFCLMIEANISILKGESKKERQIIQKYMTAGINHQCTEGLMQAGDYYENVVMDYDRAIELYEQAFTREEAIGTLPDKFNKGSFFIVRKLLHCAIVGKKFEKLDGYIQYALYKGYFIQDFIFAGLLWKGQKREAIAMTILMLQSEQGISDMPSGTIDLLNTTIDEILLSQENSPESDIARVQASFTQANFLLEGYEFNTDAASQHWDYVLSILNYGYADSELHDTLKKAILPILGNLINDDANELSPSKLSMYLITKHAKHMFFFCHKGIKSSPFNETKQARLQSLMNRIKETTVSWLQQFPNSDELIQEFLLELQIPLNSDEE